MVQVVLQPALGALVVELPSSRDKEKQVVSKKTAGVLEMTGEYILINVDVHWPPLDQQTCTVW